MPTPVNDLVTGDAVVLDLRPAELVSRAIAFGLDVLVLVVVFVGALLAMLAGGLDLDDALTASVGVVLVVGVFVAIPVTVETLTRGRSLGKLAMGLRVVRVDGGPIRFRHALARGLAGFVVDFGVFSFFTGAGALVSALVTQRGQRLGDLLAGTIVVRVRVPVVEAPLIMMPPPLGGWATTLELGVLPDALALAARQFLQRATLLDPAVRASLRDSLAGDVAARVSPPPPPGTPAEAYLAAVVVERRRREDVRLAAQRRPPVARWSAPAVVAAPDPATPPPDGFAPPR